MVQSIVRSSVAPVENVALARMWQMAKKISPQKKQEPTRKIKKASGE